MTRAAMQKSLDLPARFEPEEDLPYRVWMVQKCNNQVLFVADYDNRADAEACKKNIDEVDQDGRVCWIEFKPDHGTASALPASEDARDAARYRWLREQHWNESNVAVVLAPKKAVKLGYDCPSGQRLDEIIDAARSASASKEGS